MKYSLNRTLLSVLVALTPLCHSVAQEADKPTIKKFSYSDQSILTRISDNGQWVVTSGSSQSAAQPKLINVSTGDATELATSQQAEMSNDVTDDGNIVVGTTFDRPAYWTKSTGKWTVLDKLSSYTNGTAMSITPDGKYAVGALYNGDGYESMPALWDMTSGRMVATPGLPTKDMAQTDQKQKDFLAIGADGRYILGSMSFSYLPSGNDPGGCFYYVYDRTTSTYKPIGFTETATGRWIPKTDGLVVILSAEMSNDGAYVTGKARIAKQIAGSEFPNEYDIPFLYKSATDEFIAYDETASMSFYGSAAHNSGVVLAATPSDSPVREWSVRSGKYWYTISEILKQKYGMDFYATTGYDNTGTPISISNDGKRIVCMVDPYISYVLTLPVPVTEVCEGLKLLGTYIPTPAEGSTVSHLKNISLQFDRNIAVVGEANTAEIQDADGNTVYRSVGFAAEGKELNIRFRTGTLADGESYRLFIPEGTVAMADDQTQTNSDIAIKYYGRADMPVEVTAIAPADNSAIAKIDYSTNPVMFTFNTNVALTDTARAYMYRNDEASPFLQLQLATKDNMVAVYPATTQMLFDGSTYRLVIMKGSVTDVAGNNGNEQITANYRGTYIREISANDVILFEDNFDHGQANFMFYDGDKRTPNSEMASWDFTNNLPWSVARDTQESTDFATVSHSTYLPAGQSDDWMVLPQLFIPDMLCNIKFQSQSYRKAAADRLKVIVWESNNIYNTLTKDIVDKIKAQGKVVYDELQTPGASEETLAGDWKDNTISLADYAGKNIYIAFLNDNNNQSAVFVDNLQVRHDMNFLVSFTNENTVVAKNDMAISGVVVGNNDNKAYSNLTLTLKDADGNAVDTYTASALNLKKGDKHNFKFEKPLPLQPGNTVNFTVVANLDGEENEIHSYIKNLQFSPIKRVVLEEYSGRQCGNCPLGIIAVERMEEQFGDQLIPIVLRTYGDDPLGIGLADYADFLTIPGKGAPSAIINRNGIGYPAKSVEINGNTEYFFAQKDCGGAFDEKLWADFVEDELSTPAESDISVKMDYNDATKSFDIPCTIRYALNAKDLNVNLFAVILENNLLGFQENYIAQISNPLFGEWGKGGSKGQAVVYPHYNHDVARTWIGTTFNGTGGYIPQNVTAGETYTANLSVKVPETIENIAECEVVVMMIDANTGRVINAAKAACSAETGIDCTDKTAQDISVNAANGEVTVNADGYTKVTLISANGSIINRASGHGNIRVDANGHKGLTIVKVVNGENTIVKKTIIK